MYFFVSEEPPGKRKKSNHGDAQAAPYEKQPRKLGNSYKESDIGAEDRIQLLPVKGKDGLIQRSITREEEKEGQDSELN